MTLRGWIGWVVVALTAGAAAGQPPADPPDILPPIPEKEVAAEAPPAAHGAKPAAGATPDKAKPPAKWHGHKHPIQPPAPAGAAPVAPTGPGYYTLLELVQGTPAEKPPRWPYPRGGPFQPSFSQIDFSYLDAVPSEDRVWAEKLKRVPVGDHWLMSTGGEFRYRYNYETNSRLTGLTDIYNLYRNRLYVDVWYEDQVRIYGEFIYADVTQNDLPPYPRDVNRGDILQLFADVKLFEAGGNPVSVRLGRQELFYGSQRLISPNDWGDNRVRFDGVKAFYRSEKLDADLFVTQPVVPFPGRFDSVDNNIVFTGLWFTYKPEKNHFVDAYYLNLDNAAPLVAQGQFRAGAFNINTVGGRYYGRQPGGFLWDLEGAFQFGSWADQSVIAQAYSTYFGYTCQDVWATPTIWAGYDYASGDPDPNKTGQHRTFNQLFPFGHYYFGFVDFVGRQNIHDWTVQGYAYPMKWITTGVQYHVFRLDSNKDALYPGTASGLNNRRFRGAPPRRDPTGRAGNDVGTEIDVLANFHLTDRQDIFVSYSHFFPGQFIKRTGPSNPADFLYLQYAWRW